MSAKWTIERLDSLPENTVIEWTELGGSRICYGVRISHECWHWLEVGPMGGRYSGEGLLHYADYESIRVVSVPIDALLADETVWDAEDAFVSTTHLAGSIRDEAETVLRAAIAHVIGGRHE